MWCLFTVIYFILIPGSTHGVFLNWKSVNPEANMNIVSCKEIKLLKWQRMLLFKLWSFWVNIVKCIYTCEFIYFDMGQLMFLIYYFVVYSFPLSLILSLWMKKKHIYVQIFSYIFTYVQIWNKRYVHRLKKLYGCIHILKLHGWISTDIYGWVSIGMSD
jgi:hypothetical protein